MHYFSTLFGKELYTFWTDLLSIIRSLNTVFTAIGICHTIMLHVCLLGQDGTGLVGNTTKPVPSQPIKTPDDGQYICPKHAEFFTK